MEILYKIFISLPILYFSLSIHEFAHAFIADKCGDSTARYLGRLTLNPLSHIDPIGTVLLPIMAIITNLPLIGWAKPVPINTLNLKNPKIDNIKVSLAGILANLTAAVGISLLLRIMLASSLKLSFVAAEVVVRLIMINVLLAVFNLIPIPPLDGSHILKELLPYRMAYKYASLQNYSYFVLIILIVSGILGKFLGFMLGIAAVILLPSELGLLGL